jgi:hypothetical protein
MMILEDGTTTHDIKRIAKEQVSFYKDLYEDKTIYSAHEVKEANRHFFNKDKSWKNSMMMKKIVRNSQCTR